MLDHGKNEIESYILILLFTVFESPPAVELCDSAVRARS